MKNIIKIAVRNLFRYRKRAFLTSSLIAIGVILVIVFAGVGVSFKESMIGILTNSMLADIQVHRKGYVESIDNLPLNLSISSDELEKLEEIFKRTDQIEAYTLRTRFGAMISNYIQTSNIRLSAVYPEMENKTCPALVERIEGVTDANQFVKPGEIIVPDILVKGLSLNIGDDVVIVATNRDGSVNGITLRVAGRSEGIMGPQGKDGYIHMEDAKMLLRIEGDEISEIAIRVKNFGMLNQTYAQLEPALIKMKDKSGKPIFEIHTWKQLSPFSSIARIVDLLIMMVRIILISIVLISIMNIMMMSVYERTSEIGTIAAIGTSPGKIRSLFLVEGFLLGLMSTLIGIIIGVGILSVLNLVTVSLRFGMIDLTLAPSIPWAEVIISAVIVVIISVFASWQPAHKAANLEPVDALRQV